jgi:hypothetical protein
VTSPDRADAAAALMTALREVAEANERLQLAAAWVFEAFGDHLDAETVRMLPVFGGPDRPGRPPVPGTRDQALAPVQPLYVTGDETPDETGTLRHGIGMPEWVAKIVDRTKRDEDGHP